MLGILADMFMVASGFEGNTPRAQEWPADRRRVLQPTVRQRRLAAEVSMKPERAPTAVQSRGK